jgi:two-component system sensor histidine kinase PilS (NtrC family)
VASAQKRNTVGLDRQTERRLVWLMGGRLFLALTSLVIAAGLDGIGRELSNEARNGIYWTVTFAFFAAVISGTSFGRIRKPVRFAATQIAMDVAIVTSLVHFDGGRESVFTFLYVLVILYAAFLFKSLVAIGAAGLSVIAYGVALITANAGWGLGERSVNGEIQLLHLFAVWVVQGGALFAVGALASLLSRELQRTGAALDRSTSDLRILRDLHRSTVESIMSGLLTTDSEGQITSFNPEAERITGMQVDEVLGRDLESVIPGAASILKSFGGSPPDGPERTRLSYQNLSGDKLYLGLADSILRGEGGIAQGHVVIFQDVTNVVAMESDLTRSERLAAVGELSANIAHEIRNPLASISGSIQILMSERHVDDESVRLMGIVVRETDRLNHLITDFLSYARPAPTVTRPVEVDRLFSDLIEMIEPTLPSNIELQVDIRPGHWIEADPDQLSQMLWNLCLNGVQAMPEGGALGVSVGAWYGDATQAAPTTFRQEVMTSSGADLPDLSPAAEAKDAASGWLEIKISDAGCGIPEETAADIFEPFFTTKRQGTGMGLPTVHRIVENHGGELQLDSRVNEGTVFRIRFPGVEVIQ